MDKMNNYFKLSLFAVLLAAMCLSSCSSSSDGDTDGAGSVSDQDLTLDSQRFGDGNIPNAEEGGPFGDIMFDYDSSSIRQDQIEQIRINAGVLVKDPSLQVQVEGHCDKRGTSEYNLALGEERAKSVAAMLVSFGAEAKKVATVSYGEEIPLDPADSEDAYARNRRVHFALTR